MSDAEEKNNERPGEEEDRPTASYDGSAIVPGSQIGPFRIERELGRGGMGAVYLGHDTKLDRPVAIKSLPAEVMGNRKARSRFSREARVLASLNHPNIATIYDEFQETEDVAYLILEYVPGQTLAERIAKKPLKLEEALSIALQIAEAVAAAHEHNVIHRDLKPGNIKITPEGKVKVLDFGLAKAVGSEGLDQQSTVTEPGRVIGTPAYMSPEQARGKPTDKRSDIWSFGCVLYEMLTGRIPFKGETISDTLANILDREPNWSALPDTIPANIQVLLRRCLEKERRRRLRDIGDIAITLEDTTIELQRPTLRMKPVEAGPPHVWRAGRAKSTKWSRRVLPWLVTGAAVTLLVLFGFIIGLKLGRPAKEQAGKPVSQPIVKSIKAIVVLPFENLSGDPEQEYFVDGMTDALSAELGKIKALRVISRTSAMQYKDTDKVIPEIAEELGVDAVIEGSVLKAGNDVRVTAQLVDGRTDAHLWSDSYTGTLTNILALQSQVTLAIAREIEIALTPEEEVHVTRTEPVNADAYEAYLKGKFFHEKQTEKSFKTAADYYKQAIEIEPDYAEAYAWLCRAYWVPSVWGYSRPRESIPKARSAANKALALDEKLAIAHVVVGDIAQAYDWEWQKAKESYERARELNPNDPDACQGLAYYLLIAGRFDEAIDMMKTAVKLDPLSQPFNNNLANVHMYSGQVERALEQHKEALKLDPFHLDTLSDLARDYLIMSRYADAEKSIEEALNHHGRTAGLVASLARTYALWGRKSEAEKLLRELEDRDRDEYILPSDFARVYAALGNKDEALTWLEKAYQEREWQMIVIRVSPWWESLRSDPRFDDLVRRMNFPELPVSEPAAKPIEAAQAPIEKIAVLPFTSISSESGEEWFVDGMTDALITQLGKIKALTVISRTSAMQYKNVSRPMREIAQDLGADALIEGSVIRAGNDVQVTARLIDGRTDERIWGDFFQGTFSNILALQSQVTLAIAREIEVAVAPEEKKRLASARRVNAEAYRAYLQGRFWWNKFTVEGYRKALGHFQDAIAKDPNYAPAYAELANTYNLLGSWQGDMPPKEAFPRAKQAVETALELDDTLAEAHRSLAFTRFIFDWDWPGAEQEFKRAIELDADSGTAHGQYGVFLNAMGRLAEAKVEIKRWLELDPLSPIGYVDLAFNHKLAGRYDQAIAQCRKALELDPSFPPAHAWLGQCYASQGRYDEAIAHFQKQATLRSGHAEDLGDLGFAYALAGKRGEARKLLNELNSASTVGHTWVAVAMIQANLGETDRAFESLEKAYQQRDAHLVWLNTELAFAPLRDDPRFGDLLRRMGFPE